MQIKDRAYYYLSLFFKCIDIDKFFNLTLLATGLYGIPLEKFIIAYGQGGNE